MVFTAYDCRSMVVRQRTYYSVGGGFVVDEGADVAGRSGSQPDRVLRRRRVSCEVPRDAWYTDVGAASR